MTPFFSGLALGTLAGAVLMFWGLARIARRENEKAQADPNGLAEVRRKLAEARRYLGLIATRTSINEVRKIAHKALKETGEPT